MAHQNKLMSMSEAVKEYVKDGSALYMGGFTQLQPYAAAHEIIRQKTEDLTLSTCVGLTLADQMIGAGVVKNLITAFVWNPVPLKAHCFSRSVIQGIPRTIGLEEYSVLALNLAFYAGAMGLPYLAAKTLLGTGFDSEKNPGGAKNRLRFEHSPFTGERVCLVPPIRHDLGIVQVQRCDAFGNAQAWGIMGETKYGLLSCDKIIICAEEIVETETIMRDPNRTLIPSFRVNAVVKEPWGAHPSSVAGFYDMDWRYYAYYGTKTSTEKDFEQYLDKWVLNVSGREQYLRLLGDRRVRSLIPEPFISEPVDYGRLTRHFPEDNDR